MATDGPESSSALEAPRSAAGAQSAVNRDFDETASFGAGPFEALPELSPETWQLLEERVESFEAAWDRGDDPQIIDFLIPDDPTEGQLLIELVHADLELRTKNGTHVEDYLQRFPELASRPDVVATLRRAEKHFLRETTRQFPPMDSRSRRSPDGGESLLPTLEGYDVLREVGRGGMGIIYSAVDLSLNRTVAIKTLLPGAALDERARLQREAEAAAEIQHPHVAQVFRTLEREDQLYVISEYLPGGTLESRMHAEPWPIEEAAALVQILARATAEAHGHGIVHRDLKPANILFTADDVPKIADFGLVKRLDEASAETTRTGMIAGSPSYMSPEQALGVGTIGTGVDIWALGTILYELLTGRPPFRDATVLGTLELIRSAEPVVPRRLVPRLPADLETICLRCLEKDPAKRYSSAAELADDLGRFLNGEPVRARPVGRLERATRWAKKNLAISVLAVLLGISLFTGSCASLVSAYYALQKAEQAEKAAEVAQDSVVRETAARARAERILFAVELRNAHSALAAGDPALAADLIAEHQEDRSEGDRFVLNYLDRLVRAPGETIDNLGGPAYFLKFSPDKTLLAACGKPGEIRFYHAGSWEPAGKIVANQGELNSVAFSQDGQHIASAGDDGTVVLWDLKTHEEIWRTKVFERQAYEVEYILDDKQFAVCGRDTMIVLLDAKTGKSVGELHGHTVFVQTLLVTPDGRSLISTGDDARTFKWDLMNQEEDWRYEAGSRADRGHAMALTRDGRRLVLGAFNSEITILETASGKLLFRGGVRTSRLASDTSLTIRSIALVGPDEQPVIMLDGGTVIEAKLNQNDLALMPDRPRSVWRVPRKRVRSILKYEGGASLITASDDGFIDIWHRNQAPAWTNVKMADVADCDWIQRPDGRNLLIVTSGVNGSGCWIFDPVTGVRRPICSMSYHDVQATPDGRFVVFGNHYHGGEIAAFDLSRPQPRPLWRRTGETIFTATFGLDRYDGENIASELAPLPEDGSGLYLLAKADNGPALPSKTRRAILSLDRRTGKTLARREVNFSTIFPTVSPDGQTLVVTNDDPDKIILMSTSDLSIRQMLPGHPDGARALCFSPDGSSLASTGDDLKICLWRKNRRDHVWRTEAEEIENIEFSPDGTLLVTSSDLHPPRVWDVETQQLLIEPGRYPIPAREQMGWNPARFSVDGQWLAITDGHLLTIFDGRPFPNNIVSSDNTE